MSPVQPDPLLRDVEAARLMGCSKATFWRRVADGTFPKPIKIGGMSRWASSEIAEAIEGFKSRRTAGDALDKGGLRDETSGRLNDGGAGP